MPSAFPARARSLGRRTVAVGLTALLAAGVLTTVAPAQTASAATALSCDQATLYGIAADGEMRSIDTATGATTVVATMSPANNALGISPGGRKAYAMQNRSGTAGVLSTYDAAAGTVTSLPAADPGATTGVPRGGVNPATGLYYYGGGTQSIRLGAYDPDAGKVVGQVGTVSVPAGGNGDLAFSRSGTMFVVASQYVQRAEGTVPTTAGTPTITTSTVADLSPATSNNGIAFSRDGYLFLSTGAAQIMRVDPASGAPQGSATALSGGFTPVDLASCNYPNTTSASTTIVEREKPSDQFGIVLTGGGVTTGNTATTTTAQPTATAGPVLAVGGTEYTVEQKPGNSTTEPGDYATTWQCTDGGTTLAKGTGSTATYRQPTSSTEASSEVTCAFTNVLAASAQPDSETAVSGVATTFADLLANDGGTGLSITGVTQGDHGGRVVLAADGTVRYTADRAFSGTETFRYTVADRSGGTSTTTVSVVVAPLAADDDVTVSAQPSGGSTTIPARDLLANDSGAGLGITGATVVSGGGSVRVGADGDLVYTPEPGTSGPATITYVVTDPSGSSSTATVTVVVAPTPVDDAASVPAGQSTTFTGLLGNDLGSGLTIVGATVVSGDAQAAVDGDGHVVVTPTGASSGTVVVRYTVRDSSGTERDATLTVTVEPTAMPDAKTVPAGTATTFTDLAGNDRGSSLTITAVGQGSAGGTVALRADGTVSYTSADGFSGTETFTYTEKDAAGRTSTTTVTVTVTPRAQDDSATAQPGETLVLDGLRGNDLGRGLTITGVTQGTAGGAVRLERDGTVSYTPARGASGTDSFTYTVTDAAGQQSTATVTVAVAPRAVDDARTVAAGATTALADLTGNDRGSDLVVTAVTQGSEGGAVSVDRTGAVTVTPASGFSGTETFGYTVSDAAGQTSRATVTLTVTPTARPDARTAVAEATTTFDDLAADDLGTGLTVVAATPGDQGGRTSLDDRGRVVHVGAAGFSGTETFGYTVADAAGARSSSTVTVTITPTAVDDARTTPAETPLTIADLVANDHGRGLVVTAVGTCTEGGAASVDGAGHVTYVPAPGFSGTDSFGYVATDAAGRTASAVVTVTVVPTAVPDVRSTRAGTPVTMSDLRANDHGRRLRVDAVTAGDQGGTARRGDDGDVVYAPAEGFSGVERFTYTVLDSADQASTTTVDVTVAPTASPDARTTVTGQQTVFSLMSDVRGRGMRLLSVSAPAHGTAASTEDGWVTYVPDAGFSGVDGFAYRVADAAGQEQESTVAVTVTPVAAVDSFSTPADVPLVLRAAQLTGNDRGSRLAVTRVGTASSGTATLAADGSVRFVPAPGTSGAAVFDYTATDASGQAVDSVVTVLVGPTATPDAATVAAGGRLEVAAAEGVLANDSGTGLGAVVDRGPQHGTVELAADGSWTYEPADGWSGTDTWTYTATDDRGATTTGLVTVTVTPTAVDDVAHVAAGETLTTEAPGVLGNDLGTGLVVVGQGAAAHGTLAIGSDGAVAYAPADGWSGTDEATYDVVDAEGRPATATLTIVTDPVAADDAASTVAGRAVRVDAAGGLLANDRGAGLVASLETDPAHGSASVGADGAWTYKPADGFTGTDAFTYRITAADGATTTATVTVTVRSAAVAADDVQLAVPGRPATVDPLANDAASGGQTLDRGTLVVVDPATGTPAAAGSPVAVPGQGSWSVVDGEVRFEPAAGFVGTATIRYQVTDSSGEVLEAAITVHVPAVLAFTGSSDAVAAVLAGLVALLAGLGLVLVGRRRRTAAGPVRAGR